MPMTDAEILAALARLRELDRLIAAQLVLLQPLAAEQVALRRQLAAEINPATGGRPV